MFTAKGQMSAISLSLSQSLSKACRRESEEMSDKPLALRSSADRNCKPSIAARLVTRLPDSSKRRRFNAYSKPVKSAMSIPRKSRSVNVAMSSCVMTTSLALDWLDANGRPGWLGRVALPNACAMPALNRSSTIATGPTGSSARATSVRRTSPALSLPIARTSNA